jgi:hypothetical protein
MRGGIRIRCECDGDDDVGGLEERIILEASLAILIIQDPSLSVVIKIPAHGAILLMYIIKSSRYHLHARLSYHLKPQTHS